MVCWRIPQAKSRAACVCWRQEVFVLRPDVPRRDRDAWSVEACRSVARRPALRLAAVAVVSCDVSRVVSEKEVEGERGAQRAVPPEMPTATGSTTTG